MNWLSNAYNTAKNWVSSTAKSVYDWGNRPWGTGGFLTGGQKSQNQANQTINDTTSNTGGYNIQDELANIQKQIASYSGGYKPKYVPQYTKTFEDFWNETAARDTATSEYNPYYAKKQEELAAKVQTGQTRAEQDYTIGSTLEQESLDRFLNEAGITEGRAKEDAKSAMAQIAAERGETRAETAYDRVRQNRSLVQELQNRGLAFGGMAKQAGGEVAGGRKLTEEKINRQYNAAESSTALTEGRRLEDVGLSKTSRTAEGKARTEALGLTKTRTLEDLARTAEEEKSTLEEERKYKIEQAVNQRWQNAYDQWDMDLKQFMAKYGM